MIRYYSYDGPVLCFGQFICNWRGETVAKSESKARSNLMYQFKQENHKIAGSGGISLPGKIKSGVLEHGRL